MRHSPASVVMLILTTFSAAASGKLRHHSHYDASVSDSPTDDAHKHRHTAHHYCSSKREGEVCELMYGKVCQNGSCDSACQLKGMRDCDCPRPDDDFCYLCCGNAAHSCRPAHELAIFRPNGEWWEHDSCRNCRDKPDGLPCDELDERRLCKSGRCSAKICEGREEGEVCDMKKEKICLDNQCVNPCGNNLPCDCEEDLSSYQPSGDRCQLCCYDFRLKRCYNAFRKWTIKNAAGRPIARTGLSCGIHDNKQCNRYAVCAAHATYPPLLLLLLPLLLISIAPL